MTRPSYYHPAKTTTGSEQGYMASTADLMVGLLFVFIIMVAFLAHKKNTEKETMEAQAQALKHKNEALLSAAQLASASFRDPRGAVTQTIGAQIQQTLANVRVDPSNGVISLPEDVLFDLGSSTLKPTSFHKLREVAADLSAVLSCFVANQRAEPDCDNNNPYGHEIETIFIEGHTDSIPMLREGGNTKLSLDRAISVSNALVEGTELATYRNDQDMPVFSYSAYADSRPLKGIDSTDGRNRRVDLRIILTYRPQDEADFLDRLSKHLEVP